MKHPWLSSIQSFRKVSFVLMATVGMALPYSILLSAQTAYTPNVNNVGLPENGVFSGGSIDSVQLANGNLHVDIPLLHLPGIGMDTDIHFVYDNQLFSMTPVKNGAANPSMTFYQITIGRNGFSQVSDPLQGVLKVGSHSEEWICTPTTIIPTTGSTVFVNHLDYIAFTDGNGTGHSFPVYGYEDNLVFKDHNWIPARSLNNCPESYYSRS
jgi:hypothetical protein